MIFDDGALLLDFLVVNAVKIFVVAEPFEDRLFFLKQEEVPGELLVRHILPVVLLRLVVFVLDVYLPLLFFLRLVLLHLGKVVGIDVDDVFDFRCFFPHR